MHKRCCHHDQHGEIARVGTQRFTQSRAVGGSPRFPGHLTQHHRGQLTLPISYDYLIPFDGATTNASWTCTASSGSCPDFGSETTLSSDAAEGKQQIFGSDPDDPDTFVTLATTVTNCGIEGYVDVQTQVARGRLDTDPVTALTEIGSPKLEIGCAEWLVEEPFDEPTVTDNAGRAIGRACLTDATGTATPPALGGCGSFTTGVPTPSFNPGNSGLPDGYLQLTDDRTNQVGAVLYDRGIPAKNGLILEFTQYQLGVGQQGADGIGFFLANGAYPLTKAGADGGALGYANKKGVAGLPHGYLGVGFDVDGNFAATSNDAAPQCGGKGTRGQARRRFWLLWKPPNARLA